MAVRKGLELSGVRGGVTSFDQWVSDVMADSFSAKLKGLASPLPKLSVFWFNFLNRHLSDLYTIVRRTLDLILHLLSGSRQKSLFGHH